MSGASVPPPDGTARSAVRDERARNVLIDAGAGTGKTTLLVERLVQLVAPFGDEPALDLDRIAAVTFTRRAAGDLRLRIRQALLRELAEDDREGVRRQQLYAALGKLDTAHVGTIHSFADRLLRQFPMEAGLSPAYEIAEDPDALVHETWTTLQLGAETGMLAAWLTGEPAARAAEAVDTVLEALRAGLRAESFEGEFHTRYGLDALVEGFIRQRDRPPIDLPLVRFDRPAFCAYAEELMSLVGPLRGTSRADTWLRSLTVTVSRLRTEEDPSTILSELVLELARFKDATLKRDCEGDKNAWGVVKALRGDTNKEPVRLRALADDLLASLQRRLAVRLVRLFPVVIALYERVKARHRAVDEIDLLLRLRDLLAGDAEVRARCQARFDHIFVDEFQDTDPLQAQVLMSLCEAPGGTLAAGKLTVVGDPKQSIYRFRRADIAIYEQVRERIAAAGALTATLSANFRSAPGVLAWFNRRFPDVLGAPAPDGSSHFDAAEGTVSYEALTDGGRIAPSGTPAVHVVPLRCGQDGSAGARRALEAAAMPRYLRHLVESGEVRVRDPLTDEWRGLQYGDVAVLALETTHVGLLFPEMDHAGVPYAARGGTLFLREEQHRQLLLGLRALANPDDGVAEAALLRPPFFAVGLLDLVEDRLAQAGTQAPTEGSARASAAREAVRELRRRRFERSPGATARDLLEHTAFGRAAALGPNGAQRLERLRELCLVLEQTALVEGLDFDAVTERMRDWVGSPVALNPPHPVAADAVQILTVHQAKGLEFPVVVLWDACAGFRGREEVGAWRISADASSWQVAIDKLDWSEPREVELREAELKFRTAERRRLVYVAATRARDLLVVPLAEGYTRTETICGLLAGKEPSEGVLWAASYEEDRGAPWSAALADVTHRELVIDGELEREVRARWDAAAIAVAAPRFAPTGVTKAVRLPDVVVAADPAAADAGGDDAQPATLRKPRRSRLGAMFGDVVHRAIGLALRGVSVGEAVVRCARELGMADLLREAVDDVERAVGTLRREGLDGTSGGVVRVEYPVAGLVDGRMLLGSIDLVHAGEQGMTIVDFKTDAPPEGAIQETHAAYVAQVQMYARLLADGGACEGQSVRCALLFTADGEMRWAEPEPAAAGLP